jgi:hypothetical protein
LNELYILKEEKDENEYVFAPFHDSGLQGPSDTWVIFSSGFLQAATSVVVVVVMNKNDCQLFCYVISLIVKERTEGEIFIEGFINS